MKHFHLLFELENQTEGVGVEEEKAGMDRQTDGQSCDINGEKEAQTNE